MVLEMRQNSRIVVFICAFLLGMKTMIHRTEGATIDIKTSKLHLCQANCVEYAVIVSPAPTAMYLRVYKFAIRHKSLEPSDVKQLKPTINHRQVDVRYLMKHPETVVPILDDFMQAAGQVIPRQARPKTPVYILIPWYIKTSNAFYYQDFLKTLTDFLQDKSKHDFLPALFRGSVHALKKYLYAMYKWTAGNFLYGSFSQSLATQDKPSVFGIVSFDSETNVQIAFPTDRITQNATIDEVVNGTPYLLNAQSHTMEGFDQFMKNYFDKLMQESPRKRRAHSKGIMTSPCSPRGVPLTVTNGTDIQKYIGNGDIEACRRIIRSSNINNYEIANQSPYVRPQEKTIAIYAFPDVVETLKNIGCSGCDVMFTPAQIDQSARRYCGKKQGHKTRGCVNANFIYLVLTEVYHIDKDYKIRILKRRVGGVELSWELGALITRMSLLEA